MYYILLDFTEVLYFGFYIAQKGPYAKVLVASYTNSIGGRVAQDAGPSGRKLSHEFHAFRRSSVF